jgi:uncharacterized protein YaaW (UPF0174 family)
VSRKEKRMSLSDVEQLYRSVYQDIETRLGVAQARVDNLRRMEEEYLAAISRRATEDAEAISALFANIRREEEDVVKKLQMQITKSEADGTL